MTMNELIAAILKLNNIDPDKMIVIDTGPAGDERQTPFQYLEARILDALDDIEGELDDIEGE